MTVVQHTWDSGETGWVSAADWDRNIYSDPFELYRDAKRNAMELLIDFEEGRGF